MKGCLGGIVLLIVGVIAVAIYVHQPEAASSPPVPSPIVTPHVVPVPPVLPPASPPIEGPSAPPAIALTPVAPAVPVTHGPSVAEATAAVAQSKAVCLKRLQSRADYIAAKKLADDDLAKLEALRQAGTMDGRLDASSAYNKAAKVVVNLSAAALQNDRAFRSAAETLQAAQVIETAKARQEEAAILRQIQDDQARAEKARKDQEERDAHDPVLQGIRNHRLVEGMTFDQAVEALGRKPYSITKSGNEGFCTWQVSDGEFWSAMFVGDCIVSTTHSRF